VVKILGVETSCDETAAAIVADGGKVLSNVVSSQIELHRPYGGVVPELAARNHLQLVDEIIRQALDGNDFDAVAATYGPGLAISLLIGLNAAKGIAFAAGKPFIGINHLEAHLYSPVVFGDGSYAFPLVSLIVSGGHTILTHAAGLSEYRVLGQTVDDAAGEAFDKVAKLLGLGYPGGPEIDRLAKAGDRSAVSFPRSMLDDASYDFSFSGLKTAVLYYRRKNPGTRIEDICASFQEAVVDVLVEKTMRAAEDTGVRGVSASGGVSLNSRLRERLAAECRQRGLRLFLAPPQLCADNAAMIAALAFYRPASEFSLEVAPSIGLGV
jgi:N6-L-threonylcarbamoyladenine synthase